MRRTLTAFVALSLVSFAAAAAPAQAVTVETTASTEFQKDLVKKYGERELATLRKQAETTITRTFEKRGVKAERVVITIEDARPNRPTMEQISDKIGLDPIRSVSLGGAKLSGIAYDASGQVVGKADYDWYETDLSQSYGMSTWHDASVAIRRFATLLAKSVT